uniref:Si:dkey-34d22.2 n=1 Tax=Cyprinus carpio TaxID=7962 RepID=A0A8C1T879_CYPCA
MKCLYSFKIIMIGDGNVGKSCMLYRYINGLFPEKIYCTMGADFRAQVKPGVRVKLQIWDTTGKEAFWAIFYTNTGCLLVLDLGNSESFRVAEHQYTEVCNRVNPYTVLFVLVGHKCDRKEQEVTQEEVEEFASKLRAPYIEASARSGHSVAEAFELLTRRIYQGYLSGEVRLHESWGKIHENKTN